MILCVTPNAAIDRTLIVPGFAAGRALRPAEVIVAAGGKGLNVARTIHRLGGRARCAGILRGHGGRLVADLAAAEGLEGDWTWLPGETRICTIIVDPEQRETTELYEHGTPVSADDCRVLQDDITRAASRAVAVCISGTLPPGAPQHTLPGLIDAIAAAGKHVWLDTSGASLESALPARPFAIKINADEAGGLLGHTIDDMEQGLAAVATLLNHVAGVVVLTLGKRGALLGSRDGTWVARAPVVDAISPVGSGDALLGGLVLGLSQGLALPEALRHGVAAGAANATVAGGAAFDQRGLESALAGVSVEALA